MTAAMASLERLASPRPSSPARDGAAAARLCEWMDAMALDASLSHSAFRLAGIIGAHVDK